MCIAEIDWVSQTLSHAVIEHGYGTLMTNSIIVFRQLFRQSFLLKLLPLELILYI